MKYFIVLLSLLIAVRSAPIDETKGEVHGAKAAAPRWYTQTAAITPVGSVVFGDPHLIGFSGQKFKIDGVPNKVYNLISTPTLQLNALFIKSPGENDMVVIGEIGLQVRDDALFVSRKARLRLNDEPVEGTSILFGDGGSSVKRDVERSVGGPVIETPEIKMTVIPRGYELDMRQIELLVDGNESFHGLLGQTWRTIGWPEEAKEQELSAEDAWKHLDGSIEDYEVKDGLFGTVFKQNRFDSQFSRHATPKISELFAKPVEQVYPAK